MKMLFYLTMALFRVLCRAQHLFQGAVYMEASYPAARVTRLAGLKKHSVYMKPDYPASMKYIF